MKDGLGVLWTEVASCNRCRELGLLYRNDADGRWAFPILQRSPPRSARILFVMEAPNLEDTINKSKGHLTIDPDTDPSGAFAHELLASIGLAPADVLFTNAVLCLPAGGGGKHPVTALLRQNCSSWLVRLIEEAAPVVVVAWGGKALQALNLIERHGLTQAADVGAAHPWFGRSLVALYHPGRLGRVTRKREQQLQDFLVLARFLENQPLR